jgi:nitrate/nitrite transporter NarK
MALKSSKTICCITTAAREKSGKCVPTWALPSPCFSRFVTLKVAAVTAWPATWSANIWSLVMDYTPKHMMSTVFGFGGMCAAIGGMFMTQIVGHILTVTNNNYTVLFTLIPAMYFIALTWMYFMAPRKIPTVAV